MSLVRSSGWPGLGHCLPLVVLSIVGSYAILAGRGEQPEGASGGQEKQLINRMDLSGFTIIGIADRTSNQREAGPGGIIPRQWQRFFAEGIVGKIADQAGPAIYALYTDYAQGRDGEYSFIIGVKVKAATAAPSGMVAKQVAAGRYAVITSDKGPLSKVVPDAWRRVWQLEDEAKLERAYGTDFELYDERGKDPANGQVDLYVGVK